MSGRSTNRRASKTSKTSKADKTGQDADTSRPAGTAGNEPPDPIDDGPPTGAQPSPRELVVVARPDAGLRAGADGPASLTGADVSDLASVLADAGVELTPLFGLSEDRLAAQAAAFNASAGLDVDQLDRDQPGTLPDLSVFYSVDAPDEDLDDLREAIAATGAVDAAYVKPGAEPPVATPLLDAPTVPPDTNFVPATADFVGRQGYLGPPPAGVNALWAHDQPGGKGTDVRIIDVEGAWQLGHEDLAQQRGGIISGGPSSDLGWRNHGTAVIGVYGGDRNGKGIVGIVPDAFNEMASIFGGAGGSARAIRDAADRLRAGDIILLELHRPGPRHDFQSRDDQKGYIAIEWWPDDLAAVRYAVAKGVIVVGAAGNGAENLDDPLYDVNPGFDASWKNPFNPANPTSGAVVVGAGAPPPGTHGRNHGPDRSRLGFSNHGLRVDAQGWGREVTTTGYGFLQGGSDEALWYTDTFSGTSSASPILVGALASVQGMLKADGQTPLTPAGAIALVRATGSPQQDAPGRPASQRIGNRPDIKEAIESLAPAVQSGTATRYWLTLVPYPEGGTPTLWLFVDDAWRRVLNPTPIQQDEVQRVFVAGSGEVRVWYEGNNVVGLVVTGD